MCDSWKLKLHLHKCDNQQLEVLIMHNDEQLIICENCWVKICEKGKIEPDKITEVPKPLFGCKE